MTPPGEPAEWVWLARIRRPQGRKGEVFAEILTDFPDDPTAVWGNLADKLEVDTVPGDHLGIVGTHFESLASVVSRYLHEALA